jgi:hypothetical protein
MDPGEAAALGNDVSALFTSNVGSLLTGIAPSQKTSSNCHMASYAITVRSDQAGFDVEIVAHDGVRQNMIGFKTQADAEAWIVRNAQLHRTTDPGGFRVQWCYS